MVSSPGATAPVKEGEILAAKYRIEQVIGVGGMGVVVSAMNLEQDRRVALKFLLPQAQQSDELVGRFVREAKASVKLKGTHVAKTLDVGRMDDGRAYIVMEYLEGRDLGAFLKAGEGPLSTEDAVSWMLQACEGLAEAHALGIVHRDLKPGNLFLTKLPDGRTLVKLLDFGISKSINPNASDMLSLTKTEMLLGSPLYMAPEQMRSSKYVDERSDIWAIGAIAYELLTGRVPFEADTLLDLCFKVAQERCPTVAELRSDVSAELSAVVMRCLEKEAEKRWNDIGELATALEPFGPASDRGAAARTTAVLAAGTEHGRARKSHPGLRSTTPAEGVRLDRGSDPIATAKTTAERRPVERERSTPGADVAAGGAAVAPAPSQAPDSPPISAWGATQAERAPAGAPKEKSKATLFAGAAGVLLVAVVAGIYLGQRKPSDGASAIPAATVSSSVVVAAPPAAEPPPTPPTAAPVPAPESPSSATSAHVAPTPATAATAVVPKAAAPRPKVSATASAAPLPSAKPAAPESPGGFLKVRE